MAVFLLVLIFSAPAEDSQAKRFLGLFSEKKETLIEEKPVPVLTDKNKLYALSPLLSVGGIGGGNEQNEEEDIGNLTSVQENSVVGINNPSNEAVSNDAASRTGVITYEVQPGDVPATIASSFGISTNTVLWANNLKDGSYIHSGDKLVILPVSGVLHKVKNGDTVATIAKLYRADPQKIIVFNGLSADGAVKAGEQIIVPDGKISPPPTTKKTKYAVNYPDIVGYFMRPISGGRKSQGLHPHNAVDLAISCGTPVYASAGGTVGIADNRGWNGGYGKFIKINHPNRTATLYSHLTSLAVSTGESVSQGQVIGYVGSTGHSSGCHLHFEVYGAANPFIK